MASTPVSPKVHAAGSASAITVVVLWALNQIPAVSGLPGDVKVAVAAIVAAAASWLAGWLASDPLRNLGAKFDHNPTTK